MCYALKDISVRDSAGRLDSFCLCVQWHWFSQRGLFFSKNCHRNKTDTCSNLNKTETETRFTIVRWPFTILVRQQFQGNDHEFQLTLFLRFLKVLWITWLPRPPFLLKGKISSISPYTIRIQPFINLPVFANKLNFGEKLPLVTETFHTWFPVSVKF